MEAVGWEPCPGKDVEFPGVEMKEEGDPGRGNGQCTNRRIGKCMACSWSNCCGPDESILAVKLRKIRFNVDSRGH